MSQEVGFKEGNSRIWRRLVTVPVITLVWAISLVTLPVTGAIALAADFVRDPMKMPWTRVAVAFSNFLSLHVFSLIVTTFVWLGNLLVPAWRGEANIEANSWLQRTWGKYQLNAVIKVFGMKTQIEGRESLEGGGPLIYLVRHVSLLDTIIPITYAPPRSRVFRYVLKAELLNDPLLDIVGQRLRNHFIRRGSDDPDAEIKAVIDLTQGMQPHEGYVMYPEGTRFSEKRREKILKSLERRAPEQLPYAQRLKATLPPTQRGPMALLESVPDLDVVIVSHRGLEGAAKIPSFLAGELVGKTLAVKFERFAAADIPRDPDGVRRWLEERWIDVDAFASGGR